MSFAADSADEQSRLRPGAPGKHPEFDRLARTIWRLRQPDGCPWDKVQTHQSIAKNMLEEAFEAVDAIEAQDSSHLREELGDVLMQVLLHAQIAADAGEFTLDDVCRDLNEKLVRRHPHVFGELDASDTDEVLTIWDDVKKAERAGGKKDAAPEGLLDSVPIALPALMQAQKISKRAAQVGFEWKTTQDVWDKVEEERGEFLAEKPGTAQATMEFGDLLFALVNVARKEGIDAEEALRMANRKFRARWAQVEMQAQKASRELESYTADELEVLWNVVKADESL
ncbi:MAG: nucleoside triphosphate pyrophosphohydrolase [Atopobium sp.]|uniref:nucleoside triphosphate pyrophosphohydrolase n=1 Tax=Atopobium sp. TaxID=1872650 RepID=UPI002A74A5DF|nr:nucleoside triphosphate pyrophosphohydrolase [Atopobium sp.]MDY2788858.1 nucleoside triphosphate pyrophosphohydrolase [Atopobium sp.]